MSSVFVSSGYAAFPVNAMYVCAAYADVGIAGEEIYLLLESFRQGYVIGIHSCYQPAFGQFQAFVERTGYPDVLIIDNQPDPRICRRIFFQQIHSRLIIGIVTYYDEFEESVRLVEDGLD